MIASSLFEIAEAHQVFPHPFTQNKVLQVGDACGLVQGTRVLDLVCGHGELLCQWARHYHIQGTGVDENESAIDAALIRANDLEVWSQLNFVASEVADYPQTFHQYHIVTCLSIGMIGTDLVQALDLMRVALRDAQTGLVVMGEAFWQIPPTPEVCTGLDLSPHDLLTLGQLNDQFDAAGLHLREMFLTSKTEWDHYHAGQWQSCLAWLNDHPNDPLGETLRPWLREQRRRYLHYERDYVGWGVFILQT